MLKWIKRRTLQATIAFTLRRLKERIVFENVPKLLKTKSFWLAVIGLVGPIFIATGNPELADKLQEGAEAIATEGLRDDFRWAVAFLTAIAIRLGVLKGKKEE